jgi:hypothetical protein
MWWLSDERVPDDHSAQRMGGWRRNGTREGERENTRQETEERRVVKKEGAWEMASDE